MPLPRTITGATFRRGSTEIRGIAKLFAADDLGRRQGMKIPASMLRLKGFRLPREVVAYAV